MRDAKVSHNWGTNIVIIQGNGIIGTIPITNKLGIQAKRPKVLICCDFHYGISNDEEDVMFAIELNMFSIGTITIPIHIKHVHKLVCILDIIMAEQIIKQLIVPIDVLVVEFIIPHDIVKQHLLKTFFHPEVGEMIVDETLVHE